MRQIVLLLTIAVIVSIAIWRIIPSQSNEAQLRTFLSHDSCTHACLLGIEAGITTIQQTMDILDRNNLDYTSTIIESDGSISIVPNDTLPFVDVQDSVQAIGIIFIDNVVNQVSIPVNIPVNTVMNVYGNPEKVLMLRQTTNSSYYMIYSDDGFVFIVSGRGSATEVTSIWLGARDEIQQGFQAEIYTSVDVTCSSFGEFPCVAPTKQLDDELPNR